MKIALIGYGKMGQAIEKIALQRNHQIVMCITTENSNELTVSSLKDVDVAIEFTNPKSAKDNILKCLDAKINVVTGTTGWNNEIIEIEKKVISSNTAFIHSSNFSIGVNIYFEINKLLAKLINHQNEYSVSINEKHHTQKKDAPSGTAITLAEQIIKNVTRYNNWKLNEENEKNAIPIFSNRIENIPGTHQVKYSSVIDDIEIIHTAHNRNGFALGALLAAEFIMGKKGLFIMKDVLGIE